MSHCLDYYRKWKREHNFCGLRKQDAKDIDTYLSIVEKISGNGAGLDSDFVFDHFTAGAARPLIRCKDPDASTKAMNYVIACLKRGEDVTGGDLQATIEGFMGKVKKESTQMRELEQVKGPIEQAMEHAHRIVDANKPILPLSQQIKNAEEITGMKSEDFIPKEKCVHPGAICTVNPVVINDTLRESPPIITDTYIKVSPVRDSPFKTASQVMAHDKDPLGVGDMFREASLKDCAALIAEPQQDPAKVLKEKRIQLAEDLLSCYSERFQMAARDYIRKETSWKNGAADFFYFGGEMLMDPPKAKVSSAGAAMRRS